MLILQQLLQPNLVAVMASNQEEACIFPAVKLHVSRKSSLFHTACIIPSLPSQILWRAGVVVGSHEVNAAAGAVAEELVPPIEGAAHDAVSSTHSGRRGAEPEAQLLCSRLQARPQLRGGCRRQIRFLPVQAITMSITLLDTSCIEWQHNKCQV